jgi:hypothetical protein
MTEFLPEPRDRLDGPICKLIESKDFKQALKLVEKRLVKNSTDPYLLVRDFKLAESCLRSRRQTHERTIYLLCYLLFVLFPFRTYRS